MADLEKRNWIAPDGAKYRVTLAERVLEEGARVYRRRRVQFGTPEGECHGDAPVSGYFSLDLADSAELETLWRRATGR